MPYQHENTPHAVSKPICPACAAGYHNEVLVIPEQCTCPCHGTAVPKVAKSIADGCRSIADSTESLTSPLHRISYEGFLGDCRLQTGVDV
jgi:hypothetical protein